jgi:hypothetical protein
MTATEIIRPDPPDEDWERDLAGLGPYGPRLVLQIQQQARHWNPIRAARGIARVLDNGFKCVETREEAKAVITTYTLALWPLRNDRRFMRANRVIKFYGWVLKCLGHRLPDVES